MSEEENKPKITKTIDIHAKRILLESGDSHLMWMDVLETGSIILHEMFGVPSRNPENLEEAAQLDNSCYHVTIAIKSKYVPALLEYLKSPDLFNFETPKVQTKAELLEELDKTGNDRPTE